MVPAWLAPHLDKREIRAHRRRPSAGAQRNLRAKKNPGREDRGWIGLVAGARFELTTFRL